MEVAAGKEHAGASEAPQGGSEDGVGEEPPSHMDCDDPLCPLCQKPVKPEDAARVGRDQILHKWCRNAKCGFNGTVGLLSAKEQDQIQDSMETGESYVQVVMAAVLV